MLNFKNRILKLIIFTCLLYLLVILLSNVATHHKTEQKENNNVLCIVLTNEKYLTTRAKAIWDTWGRKFENIIFTCNCPSLLRVKELIEANEAIPADLEEYVSVADLPLLHVESIEHKLKMGLKMIPILNDSYTQFSHKVNWYYMVDDDTYVFVDNLYKYIATQNTSAALIYGFLFFDRPKPGGYAHGGPGILITNESMRLLVNKVRADSCRGHIDQHGDITIGGCSYAAGVRFSNASDKHNLPRFHYQDPYTHFYGPISPYAYNPGTHNGKIGKECCSLESIGFHYVNESLMRHIHARKDFLRDLLT